MAAPAAPWEGGPANFGERNQMRSRLSYANIASTLALFAVIAGGTAAALPGKRTVQANDLKKNSVKAPAIAKDAIRSPEIKDGEVTGAEIQDGAVGGADVADQALGYQDLGSNSVVARIRSTGAVQTGDGGEASPVVVPLSGNQWAQAGNETDVFFGQLTFTEPATCGNNGGLQVEFLVDGVLVDREFSDSDPNQTETDFFLTARPYLFEPGTAKQRTAAVRMWDDCSGAGEQYTLRSVEANAVAIR
jgi:hypothetical protein